MQNATRSIIFQLKKTRTEFLRKDVGEEWDIWKAAALAMYLSGTFLLRHQKCIFPMSPGHPQPALVSQTFVWARTESWILLKGSHSLCLVRPKNLRLTQPQVTRQSPAAQGAGAGPGCARLDGPRSVTPPPQPGGSAPPSRCPDRRPDPRGRASGCCCRDIKNQALTSELFTPASLTCTSLLAAFSQDHRARPTPNETTSNSSEGEGCGQSRV